MLAFGCKKAAVSMSFSQPPGEGAQMLWRRCLERTVQTLPLLPTQQSDVLLRTGTVLLSNCLRRTSLSILPPAIARRLGWLRLLAI